MKCWYGLELIISNDSDERPRRIYHFTDSEFTSDNRWQNFKFRACMWALLLDDVVFSRGTFYRIAFFINVGYIGGFGR